MDKNYNSLDNNDEFKNSHEITYDKLKSDIEGLYSLSHKDDADLLSKIIKERYGELKVLDGTAGVGGNTISFAIHFNSVTAVEKNIERFEYLKENINSLKLNVKLINGNVLDYIKTEVFDVIFLDPPWGGPNYKFEKTLSLTLDNKSLIDVVKELKENNKIIVMKLPFNYNMNDFSKFNYQKHNIKNYLIVIID
jgi:16S rRNA G966 N2-methylase RsmD